MWSCDRSCFCGSFEKDEYENEKRKEFFFSLSDVESWSCKIREGESKEGSDMKSWMKLFFVEVQRKNNMGMSKGRCKLKAKEIMKRSNVKLW